MRSNKKGIIITIIFVLIIAAGVFAYLFFMTDTFKSNRELFSKYFVENLQALEETTNFQIDEVYQGLESENKYESSVKINMIHSEGGEVSNPLNNLLMQFNVQKDNDEEYFYADGQILYEDEAYLKAEIIKNQGNYGFRTDAIKQFVAVKRDENLENIADDIGIDITQLEMILNLIDGKEFVAEQEIAKSVKEKYMNIITTAISNGTFGKQKNALITYNDATIETNAYSVLLSKEQVASMLIEILNNVKNETEISEQIENLVSDDELDEQIDEIIRQINEEVEIPTIKIIVYEKNKKNIRTEIEIGIDKIVIENAKTEGEIKSKIKYLDVNDEQTIQYDCEISNPNTEIQGDFKINLNVAEGENEYTINVSNDVEKLDNSIKSNTIIAYTEDITTTSIKMENEIKIGEDFEETETLVVGAYVPLNEMKTEKRKELINLLKEIIPQKMAERLMLLATNFVAQGVPDEGTENVQTENTEGVEEMSQVEINKFNAKFEFYTGNEVSAENVKKLLDIVKDNINGHLITTLGTEENAKISITLLIKKDSTNDDSITEVLQKIDDNKKYKISISYYQENGLIENITIDEV